MKQTLVAWISLFSFYFAVCVPVTAKPSPIRDPYHGVHFYVPSDPNADYVIVSLKSAPGQSMKLMTTARKSKVSLEYEKRLIDCSNYTFKTLASSSTLAGLYPEYPSAAFSPIIGESISAFHVRYACSR